MATPILVAIPLMLAATAVCPFTARLRAKTRLPHISVAALLLPLPLLLLVLLAT